MNHVRSARAVLLALIVVLCANMAFGQTDLGSIVGFVKDPSGATIPKAQVTVHNETGLDRKTTTTDAGFFTITNIPPGLYSIAIESPGFKKYESHNNKLDTSAVLSVDAVLTVGAATETVEVTASATVLQTDSASVQDLITRNQIDALELNGRNPVFMANLVPGTRWQPLRLELQFQPGPQQHQRRPHPGEPHHL